MAITAAQLQVEFRATGANEVAGAIDQIDGKVQQATGGFDDFFDSIQGGAGGALRALDGVSRAMGAIAVIGGVSLIAGGARAAWDQVDAVQQATIALRAYETDARKVDTVLNDLLRFARSDAGRLFMRQELFHAAQVMKVAGAETENLTRYVEIMARSVSTGMATWGDLERVLARVVSTGRLTTVEFELLQQAGYQLDESLRNTTVSADELFDALDRGSVEVLGQTESIQGRMVQLQTAIRGVGLAFLDVDSETSMFREGGLGDRIMSGLENAPALLGSVADAARDLGNAIVGIIDFVANLVGWFRMWPDSIQTVVTSILKLVAAFGALRIAGRAMGMIGAMTGLGGMMSGIGGLMGGGGLFRGGAAGAAGFGASLASLVTRINPVGLAITGVIAVGAGLVNSFMNNKAATEEWEASLSSLDSTLEMLRRRGDTDLAESASGLRELFNTGIQEQMDDFLSAFDPANLDIMDDQEIVDLWKAITGEEWRGDMVGAREDITAHWASIRSDLELTTDQITGLNNKLTEALNDPNIDAAAWIEWATSLITGAESAEELQAAIDKIDATPLSDFSTVADEVEADFRRMGATAEEVIEIFSDLPKMISDLRMDGLGRQADEVEALGEAWQRAFAPVHEYQLDQYGQDTGVFTIVDDLDASKLERMGDSWERISQAIASGDFDNARLLADVMTILGDDSLSIDQREEELHGIVESLHEYRDVVSDVLNILGQSDLTSMLNLAGLGGDAVSAAADINQLAASMDTLFRVVVGNTNAIGSQFEALFKWADDLIAAEGVWSKLDDLLAAGRITGEHGVFTGDSEYARAQQAYNDIARDNVAIQEHILTIQAKQAPLLAANASAMEEYIGAIADMPVDEQLAALGFMDAGLQSQLGTVIELAGQFSTMGAEGEAGFRAMAEGIALTNPALFAMMESMGLVTDVTRDLDGTVLDFEISLDGATTVQDTLNNLIESIDALTVALGGVAPAAQAAMSALSSMGGSARDAMLAALPDRGAATHGDTGVPVVTGLPQTGTGGTVTFTADDSAIRTSVSEIAAMVAVVDAMEATVSILADGSGYGETIQQVSESVFAVDGWNATVEIYGDGSAYGETITEVWNSLLAVNDWSATVSILADASNVYQTIADLQVYQGTTIATSYVDIVTRRIDPVSIAGGLGSAIRGYADGGVITDDVVMVGERGPELVSLPRGSYVHTNAETMRMMNSGKSSGQGHGTTDNSITVSFAGATFSNTSREEMNAWAQEDLIPGIARAVGDRRTGMGAA